MREERLMKKIGFIGCGLMGNWLVQHLLKDGFEVIVYDTDEKKCDALQAYGAKKTRNVEKLASEVEAIVLSLPNSKIVADVIYQTLKLTSGDHTGLIVIDTSTADPEASIALAQDLKIKGIEFLDATVSGTSEMCAKKENIFMVGGNQSIYQRCEPLFKAMGRSSFYLGSNGKGAAIKLVVNLVLAINRMGLAEGLTLAKKAGLDPLQTLEILKQSAAGSKAMDQKGYRMVNLEYYPPIGHMTTHYKDVKAMLSYGGTLNCPLPLTSFTAQVLASEISKGHGDRDSSAVISFYNDLANIK